RAPITFEMVEGKGTLKVGAAVDAQTEPYRSATGAITTLNETIFTTVPGTPAWVSKASNYTRHGAKYGLKDIQLNNHNAIQALFRSITASRPNRGRLTGLLLLGYVLVWLGFGAAAYIGDLGLHSGVEAIGWLSQHSWLITAAVLIGAGIYQFTPLKFLCLEKC